MKDIAGHEGRYAILSDGRAWSYPKRKSPFGRFLKLSTTEDGYCFLCIKNRPKIHRLVAKAYIPNPLNLPQVNHKNGIKSDNRVENLEWCTKSQNIKHSYDIGIRTNPQKGKFGAKNKTSKPVSQFDLSGKLIKIWGSAREVQRELGIFNTNIIAVCLGKKKTAGGFTWKNS